MTDTPAPPSSTWHGKPLYVCPHCGTSRFTTAALERHLLGRHGIDPVAPLAQAGATAASKAPAPTPDTLASAATEEA